MRIATDHSPAPSRNKPGRSAVPARAPRRGGFRRSEVARFRSQAPSAVPALPGSAASSLQSESSLWARTALPGGMLLFWTWFAAVNWQHFVQLFG